MQKPDGYAEVFSVLHFFSDMMNVQSAGERQSTSGYNVTALTKDGLETETLMQLVLAA